MHWSVDGTLPDWLTLDEATGQLAGTPPQETDEPLTLDDRGERRDGNSQPARPAPGPAISGTLVHWGVVEAPAAVPFPGGDGSNRASGSSCSGWSTCWA